MTVTYAVNRERDLFLVAGGERIGTDTQMAIGNVWYRVANKHRHIRAKAIGTIVYHADMVEPDGLLDDRIRAIRNLGAGELQDEVIAFCRSSHLDAAMKEYGSRGPMAGVVPLTESEQEGMQDITAHLSGEFFVQGAMAGHSTVDGDMAGAMPSLVGVMDGEAEEPEPEP